jgi:hypothetical protein
LPAEGAAASARRIHVDSAESSHNLEDPSSTATIPAGDHYSSAAHPEGFRLPNTGVTARRAGIAAFRLDQFPKCSGAQRGLDSPLRE